jgi:hypothetical protein
MTRWSALSPDAIPDPANSPQEVDGLLSVAGAVFVQSRRIATINDAEAITAAAVLRWFHCTHSVR